MTHALARLWEDRRQARAKGEMPAARKVRAETDTEPVLYLYDVIDSWGWPFGVSAKDVLEALNDLGDVEALTLHINSPGGELSEGITIRNLLRQHKARVTTVVDGLAASAASFVALAGDEVVMAPNAEIMVHEPWGAVVGDAQDMHAAAGMLDKAGDNIARMYAHKAGGDVAEWRDVMHQETWYSDEEAVTAGLADRVLELDSPPVDVSARFDLTVFNFAGRRNAPAPRIPAASADGSTENPEEGASMSFLNDVRQRLGITDEGADEGIVLAALDEVLAERAEPQGPESPPVPDGAVVIDQTQLDALRAQAQAGVEARAQQQRERRDALVSAAVSDGRIPPARRDHWLAQLEADPGSEQVLAALAPGLVPLAETGFGNAPDATEDDALYASLFGKEA